MEPHSCLCLPFTVNMMMSQERNTCGTVFLQLTQAFHAFKKCNKIILLNYIIKMSFNMQRNKCIKKGNSFISSAFVNNSNNATLHKYS